MIGKTFGHYQILGKIGTGGMGEVYRARDTRLERDVAIKMIPAHVASDPERIARFEREARAVAALQHPNIVTIHAVESIDGRNCIVMELVDGLPARGGALAGTLHRKSCIGTSRDQPPYLRLSDRILEAPAGPGSRSDPALVRLPRKELVRRRQL